MEGKRVVVVGGGAGGAHAAVFLQKDFDLHLVDPKEYFEILWAELRSMVEPSFSNRSVIYHKDYLTKGRLVTSAAVNITENEVHTADGTRIPYDYCVISTGHKYNLPHDREERIRLFEADNEKIKAADSVLIVGGGPTGVELAAEIVVDYPGKKVTLVHRGPRLMDFVKPKASRKALSWLTSKGVDVKLNESVNLDSPKDGTYVTASGETIKADCHFLCIGKPPGSGWLKETILNDKLDNKGRLMVDANLRVKGHTKIFAIGDITDIPEMKQGYLAEKHAGVVAKNIKLLTSGADESKLAVYKPGSDIALVSLGRKEGVAQFPMMVISGCIPGKIKSGDLFVGKTRKQLGLQP
jgi:NADH dehydrogenase FAD-containing subunit